MAKVVKNILLFIGVLFPSACFADGGLPILFVINTYAFVVGSFLIVILEFMYLKKVFYTKVENRILLWWIVKFNIVSALFGILILPIFLMIIQVEPIFYIVDNRTTSTTMSLIWFFGFSLDFILAFIGTVYIEYKMLKKYISTYVEISDKLILKHTIIFNSISYLGLLILVVLSIISISGS